MPKSDINKGFGNINLTTLNRKKTASDATNALLSGTGLINLDQQPAVRNTELPLEDIQFRPTNQFHDMDDNLELDESILRYGLINPIAVCHHEGEKMYTISAGSRRYKAMVRLRTRFPDNPRFWKIECKIYILTNDPEKLKQGFPYITEEQEEGIYRDSNNLARQLTDTDIASQMRYIVKRFEDPEYVSKLRATAESMDIRTYSNPDLFKLVSSVMSSQNLWKREKTRQYLVVYKAGRNDLLDEIEQNLITVNGAYKEVIQEKSKKRKRATNKLPALMKSVDAFAKEAENRSYTEDEIAKLKQCKELIERIIYKHDTN